MDYLEAAYPATPLLPADALGRAKVAELCTYLDWHIEIVGRELYGSAYFGAPALSDERKVAIKTQLEKKRWRTQALGQVLALYCWRHHHPGRLQRVLCLSNGRHCQQNHLRRRHFGRQRAGLQTLALSNEV